MPVDDIIRLLLVFSLVVLPALGVTARFAIKPIVDAILRLREGGVLPGEGMNALTGEMRQLHGQIHNLQEELAVTRIEVARLREAENFHLALSDGGRAARETDSPRPS